MPRKTNTHHARRHGHHQKRTRAFHRVYLPYLPMILFLLGSIILSGLGPRGQTLAYATELSNANLLSATNSHRASNGKGALTINSQLSAAAQAKANDMVARNYWSHDLPDGQKWWVFIVNAGYKYQKAGENLAYGFDTSSDTVTGWMNSPGHRANMLDGSFSEVGFGYANSPNFVGSGPETIIVAEYGQPQVLSASAAPAPASSTPAPVASSTPAPSPAAPSNSTPSSPAPTAQPTPTANNPAPAEQQKPTEAATSPITNTASAIAASPKSVSRIETLSNGKPWILTSLAVMSSLAILIVMIRHLAGLRHVLQSSEKFILHHTVLDSTLISLTIFGITLGRSVGVIL